ncbi:hypothetical protein LSUE1_G009236, partial [Lachnellula suecica]
MRRMIVGAKKALHRDKRQSHAPQIEAAQPDQSQYNPTVFNLSISAGLPGGYVCWDQAQCGLCSRFLNRWFILDMFTSKFVNLGKTTDLLAWTQEGGRCALCNYIALSFVQEIGGELPPDANFIVRWDTKDTAIRGGRKDEISSFVFELSWGFPQQRARSVRLNCFTYEDQEFGHYVITRPANPNASSPAAFSKAKTWISECVEGHVQYQQASTSSSEMPSRLLEISLEENGDYSIRLHESNDEAASYIALSYIWGGPQACRTLTSNIEEHMQRIDSKKLPRTIMDAVRCTNNLDLKYLWVDSLCIIQDSPEDKAKEIGRMSIIYKNSYVTLSAAKATSCEKRFLEPRSTPEDLLRSSFKLEILTPKDPVALNEWIEKYRINSDFTNYVPGFEIEEVFKISPWNDPDAWNDVPSSIWLAATPLGTDNAVDLLTAGDIADEPISKRGWCLQESWLPPRMLIYGSAQLLWKCNAGVQSDGGIAGPSSGWDIRTSYRTDENGEMVYEDGTKVTKSGKESIFAQLWRNIVQESSQRALTVPADKLNALAGIVQDLQAQTGDENLAGLWKSRLIAELSWHQETTLPTLWSTARTCPSWSWIKTDGPISFSSAENSNATIIGANIARHEFLPDGRLEVEGGIKMKAPMGTLPISQSIPHFKFPTPNSSRLAFTNAIFPDGGLTNPEFESVHVNGKTLVSAPPDMRFLELSWGKRDGHQNIADESRGLVLVPVKNLGRSD